MSVEKVAAWNQLREERVNLFVASEANSGVSAITLRRPSFIIDRSTGDRLNMGHSRLETAFDLDTQNR